MDPITLGTMAIVGATTALGARAAAAPSAPPPAPPPVVQKPSVMPLPDDEATERARRRELTKISEGSGRASTFLSDTKLGSSGREKLG